jgi:hypothetical protein
MDTDHRKPVDLLYIANRRIVSIQFRHNFNIKAQAARLMEHPVRQFPIAWTRQDDFFDKSSARDLRQFANATENSIPE